MHCACKMDPKENITADINAPPPFFKIFKVYIWLQRYFTVVDVGVSLESNSFLKWTVSVTWIEPDMSDSQRYL